MVPGEALMGEAKWRKTNDPSFARPFRGLLINNPVKIEANGAVHALGHLDKQDLRTALLFFDQLVWPVGLVNFGSGPDEGFLEDMKILERPQYFFGGTSKEVWLQTQAAAFEDLDRASPGSWSIAQGPNSLMVEGRNLIDGNGVFVQLTAAIPVPDQDVPLAEILEFKLRRSDELWTLRNELDTMIAAIDASDDKGNALQQAIPRIDIACADAIRVGKEWHFPMRLSGIKASFELRPFVTIAGFVAGQVSGKVLELTQTNSLLSGILGAGLATAPVLKIAGDFGWRGLRPRQGPYRYVSDYHREVF